jgi:hypothetical protein
MTIYPQLSAKDFLTVIRLQNDANGDYIAEWKHPTFVCPTDSELAALDNVAFNSVAELSAAVQAHINATARSQGYDSALSCVSYITSTVATYRTEAATMRDWRDAVWTRCYELLAEVQAGTRPIPTESELIALLPRIGW